LLTYFVLLLGLRTIISTTAPHWVFAIAAWKWQNIDLHGGANWGSSEGRSSDTSRSSALVADGSMNAIKCMHLIEQLNDLSVLFGEAVRLLKPPISTKFTARAHWLGWPVYPIVLRPL